MQNKKNKAFNRQEKESEKADPENSNNIPIHSYWFFAIMVIIASSMFVKHGTVDIQLHDTYFVLGFHHIVVAISILFLIFGFMYWSLRNSTLTKWMTNFHSLLTMATIGTFYMTCFQEEKWNFAPVLMMGIGLFLLAQVILAINIFLSKSND